MTPATPASAGVVILDFLPPPNSPSEEHTDKARAKYGGARSHPGPQPLRIPNPYNDESSTALHTHFGGCVAILGSFSLRSKNAQTTSTTKYRERTAAQTPTRNLYDNETRTAPHTRFGGDLHAAISDPTNALTRCRAKRRSAQLPRPRLLIIRNAIYMTTQQIWCHTPAEVDNAHPEIRERAAAQDPNPRPSASYTTRIKYNATHPPKRVLSPCAKPHPKPAQTKAKAKYGRTQAPESPAPNTHGDCHDELNMIPYAAAAGLFSHHETSPTQEYIDKAQGEIWAHAQPPKMTLKHLYTTTNRIRCHTPASAGFLPPRNLHAMNAPTRPGRTTGARTATQDSNTRLSTTNTTMNRIRCHTPAKAGTFSHCETPPKASTDEAQGEIPTYAATRKPSNHNEKLNMIPHTRFSGCVVLLAQWLTRSWPNKAPMGPQLAPKPQPKWWTGAPIVSGTYLASFQGWSLLMNRIKTGGDICEILKDSVEHGVKSTWRMQFASDKHVLIIDFWVLSCQVDPIKNEGGIRKILLESMGIAPI
ncbi:hypothetical protein BS47DRAFT_1358160 [Hydnum rufescens UP504]|uniref:Uncharacterized protein n=1 Tax=Hydnum rufescens UP504 TaxID=1448309 RepID=A0A9P6DZJ0_9AGAM|nr:hypothetical protein BS47DRAFT_1358160 [Hydnum rufescens UP504]